MAAAFNQEGYSQVQLHICWWLLSACQISFDLWICNLSEEIPSGFCGCVIHWLILRSVVRGAIYWHPCEMQEMKCLKTKCIGAFQVIGLNGCVIGDGPSKEEAYLILQRWLMKLFCVSLRFRSCERKMFFALLISDPNVKTYIFLWLCAHECSVCAMVCSCAGNVTRSSCLGKKMKKYSVKKERRTRKQETTKRRERKPQQVNEKVQMAAVCVLCKVMQKKKKQQQKNNFGHSQSHTKTCLKRCTMLKRSVWHWNYEMRRLGISSLGDEPNPLSWTRLSLCSVWALST